MQQTLRLRERLRRVEQAAPSEAEHKLQELEDTCSALQQEAQHHLSKLQEAACNMEPGESVAQAQSWAEQCKSALVQIRNAAAQTHDIVVESGVRFKSLSEGIRIRHLSFTETALRSIRMAVCEQCCQPSHCLGSYTKPTWPASWSSQRHCQCITLSSQRQFPT